MTQLMRQFTDGVAAFKVTADGYVLPLYSSENVCGFLDIRLMSGTSL